MVTFWERLERWKQEALRELRKRWWWVIIVVPVATFIWALVSARIIDATNRYIDQHVTLASIRPALHAMVSLFSGHPFVLMLEAVVLVFLVIVVHAYWVSSKTPAALPPDAPAVVLEFTKDRLPWDARSSWVGERPVFLRNIGASHALDVRVESLMLDSAVATFNTAVPIIDPGQAVPIRPDISEISEAISGISEFEVLLQHQWVLNGWDDSDYQPLAVPMRITYRNRQGVEFCTDLVVKYSLKTGAIAAGFKFG